MAKTTNNELMTAAQARDYLGVSWQKITDLIKEGKLSVFTSELDRRKKLIRRSDLDQLQQPVKATVIESTKPARSSRRD